MATAGVGYNPQANWPIPQTEVDSEAAAFIPWLLIQSQPCKELKVQAKLEAAHIESFFPQVSARRSNGQNCGLFPSYLFAAFPAHYYQEINEIIGRLPMLGRVVCFGYSPAIVATEIVDEIRERLVGGVIDLEIEHDRAEAQRIKQLQRGDQIRVNGGCFDGLTGIFEHTSGADRSIAFLSMLNRMVRVELDSRQVAKV